MSLTEPTTAALRRSRTEVLLGAGFNMTEVAWLLGTARSAILRDRQVLGIGKPPRNRPEPACTAQARARLRDAVEDNLDGDAIRRRIADMRPLDAVDELLYVVEQLMYLGPRITEPAPGLRLPARLQRLLYRLDVAAPLVVSREVLKVAIWGPDDDPPDGSRAFDIYVSRLRAALRQAGLPATIVTERGVGLRLLRPKGLFDWGCAAGAVSPPAQPLERPLQPL